jgi:serine/threonine protein kinase
LKNEEDIKNIMHQLLSTLSYLHRHSVVHRDLKLSNFLYDPVSKMIKLIDFGISKRFKKRGAHLDMWTITGTLYYRAPEMFSGGYREGVDIWAAGVIFYKLVTGRTPFESEYISETIQHIREAKIELPPEFNCFSKQLKNLLTKMLREDPESRPSARACLKHSWFCPPNPNLPTIVKRSSMEVYTMTPLAKYGREPMTPQKSEREYLFSDQYEMGRFLQEDHSKVRTIDEECYQFIESNDV